MQELPVSSETPSRLRRWAPRLVQGLASGLVLVVLSREVEAQSLSEIVGRVSWGWMSVALVVKAASLLVHEIRLWLSLNPPRPPLRRVAAIGFAAGALNLVLPARGGDLACIAMLRRECGVSVGAATASVGVVAFLEAAMFGLTFLVVLVAGAPRWRGVIGNEAHLQAVSGITLVTLTGVAIAVVGVIVGRRFVSPEPEDAGPSPMALVRETLRQASQNMTAPAVLALNTLLALVQVAGMVGAFALLFPALGLSVPLPLLAAAGVLAISAVAGVVLPPSFGAGPAAAAVAVLAVFGIDQSGALAYAAGWWLISQVPAALIGLPCLWGRGEQVP